MTDTEAIDRAESLPAEYVITTVAQLRALAHPLRQRVLDLLEATPRTNQQLALALGEPPARVHFHVRTLAAAGLLALVEERAKGGAREKYYRAVAQRFRLGPAVAGMIEATEAVDAVQQAALRAAGQSLAQAVRGFGRRPPGLRVTHQQADLSPAAVARIAAHLDAIDAEFAQALPPAPDTVPITLTYAVHELPAADA